VIDAVLPADILALSCVVEDSCKGTEVEDDDEEDDEEEEDDDEDDEDDEEEPLVVSGFFVPGQAPSSPKYSRSMSLTTSSGGTASTFFSLIMDKNEDMIWFF